ncbi:MAG: competence/damage-inducible protein A [Bacillota bacterium]
MNCSIISVGTELLFGQIINTNTVFLSKELNEIGINVHFHFTVGDNPLRLAEIIRYALSVSDIVITTGGLGPTQDDLTKETIAKAVEKDLYLHEPSLVRLSEFFHKINRPMCDNNKKQAYLPSDCIPLLNEIGTAPGFILEHDRKIIITLPGPPKEMELMYQRQVKEYLKAKSPYTIHSKILRLFGIGESALETELEDLISNQTNPTIAPYAKVGEVSLRVTAKAEDIETCNLLMDPIIQEIEKRVGKYIYSYCNEELHHIVANELMKRNISISLAESCTGGIIASKLTSIPGISACFDRSIVTYSNEAKIQELGVLRETLSKFGAVSNETAIEMTQGLKRITNSDVCLSVTGIAGPEGGTKEKPVGLVYIAAMYHDKIKCKHFYLSGSRERIRNYTALLAFDMIRRLIQNDFSIDQD